MAEGQLKVSVEVSSIAVARPGDTILIGFAHELDDETIAAFDEHFAPYVEAGIKIGYLDQVTSMVVIKGDGADTE